MAVAFEQPHQFEGMGHGGRGGKDVLAFAVPAESGAIKS
jgi:hypothetical protein